MKTKPSSRKRTESGRLTATLVRIGNSRGVRLPKAVIEQVGLTDRVEIRVRGDEVILRRAARKNPRAGWREQIKAALAEHGEDVDEEWLNAPLDASFEEKEWRW